MLAVLTDQGFLHNDYLKQRVSDITPEDLLVEIKISGPTGWHGTVVGLGSAPVGGHVGPSS